MGKRTRTAARAGKVKGPANGPESKPLQRKELIDGDIDSDDGSFLDDEDLGDFLPAAWTGGTQIKTESKTPATKKPATTTTVSRDFGSLSIYSQAAKAEETMNSKFVIHAPLPSSSDSKVEDLRSEIQSLKAQIANKTALHAKELLSLKDAYNEAVSERMRAVEGHRKLLNTNTALKATNDDLRRKWASTNFKLGQAEKVLETLKKDKSAQDVIIKDVRRQAKEHMDERKRLIAVAAAAERSKNTRHADYNKLVSENHILKSQIQQCSTAENNQNWRARCQQLRWEHKGRQESLNAAQIEIASLQHEVTNLKVHQGSIERKLDTTISELSSARTSIDRQVATIKGLKSDISKLEGDRDLKAPLLQIGVDVRLRNLENARETLLEVSKRDIDRAIIVNGNIAAHSANGAVDAAMFQAGLVPDEYIEEATGVFKDMYKVNPSQYGCWCPKVLQLFDFQATIRTVKSFRDRNTSLDLRSEHSEVISTLLQRYASLGTREFETDEEVEELMERLELLTTEIVQVDRSRVHRR